MNESFWFIALRKISKEGDESFLRCEFCLELFKFAIEPLDYIVFICDVNSLEWNLEHFKLKNQIEGFCEQIYRLN